MGILANREVSWAGPVHFAKARVLTRRRQMRRSMENIPAVLTISIGALALLVSIAGFTTSASGATGGPVGTQAKTVDLVEDASLKLASEEGAALVEHGRAAGTYDAPVTAIFT